VAEGTGFSEFWLWNLPKLTCVVQRIALILPKAASVAALEEADSSQASQINPGSCLPLGKIVYSGSVT
jgi:hypothetical protein